MIARKPSHTFIAKCKGEYAEVSADLMSALPRIQGKKRSVQARSREEYEQETMPIDLINLP